MLQEFVENIKLLKGNAMPDQVHLLASFPSTIALASALNKIKSSSSNWAKNPTDELFSWQKEYGAFPVSKSQVERTVQ